MRKIDKSKILSKDYENWLNKLRENNKPHKTCSQYKIDVIMSLFYCQQGVCAYTEMLLCSPKLIEKKNWNKNSYKNKKVNTETFGELEHFEPSLKNNKFCEWDNLFMVHSKANRNKNAQEVATIKEFKPDLKNYNPFEIFDYDEITNEFIPNTEIKDEQKQQKIEKLINLLSINQATIKYERETFIKSLKLNKTKKIDRFFTAVEMISEKI